MNRTRLLAAGVAAGAALAAPRFTLAAGPAATVKIGFLESFSGVFSDLGAIHKLGALAAFENYSFDGAKSSPSIYHAFDHQCAQDVYGGASVSSKTFAKTEFMYEIVAEVPAAESDGNADSVGENRRNGASRAASGRARQLAAQHPAARAGYAPKTF